MSGRRSVHRRTLSFAALGMFVLSLSAFAVADTIARYPGGPIYALLEKTANGYRFTRVSFGHPTSNAVPWVELMSARPLFFTGIEQNCALGQSVAKVNVKARRCESLVPQLFRVERKSGSQRLTNALGALSTIGMSGSLRMTDVQFDPAAYESAFREADAHLGVPRSRMQQDMQQADAQASDLIRQFRQFVQTSVSLSTVRQSIQVTDAWDPEGAGPDTFAQFLDSHLVEPLRTDVQRSQEAEVAEREARHAEQVAREQREQAEKARREATLAQFPAPRRSNTALPSATKKSWSLADVTKRANAGDADAEEELGRRLWNGEGIDEDDAAAAEWLARAAKQGNATALARLGNMYLAGDGGLPKDDIVGGTLVRNAANAGDPFGEACFGNLYLQGEGGLEKDDTAAESWIRKSANAGSAYGQLLLGTLYDNGTVVASDPRQALAWYRKSADQGNADAQNDVGVMYMNGTGVAQDYEQAQAWFEKAAAQGNKPAKQNLQALAHNRALVNESASTRRGPGPGDDLLQRQMRQQQCRSSCPFQCRTGDIYHEINEACVAACEGRCWSVY